MLTLFGDLQVPFLAAMLLSGCFTKAYRVLKARSVTAGLGPTALFPLRMRTPAAFAMCATEFGLGMGLIVTCSDYGQGRPASLFRLGGGLLFLVAAFALIELRSVRPDVGCGCFGEFSQTPVTGRTIIRSVLLAACSLSIVELPPIQLPVSVSTGHVAVVLLLFAAELGVFALLSPEVHDLLVRIGYSAPCELRVVSPEQSIAALHRSSQWRKHSKLIDAGEPSDVWRELCWRYVAYPSKHAGREAELIFAVRLESRRPVILSALVDTATGAVLPWQAGSARPARRHGMARTRVAYRTEAGVRADPVVRAEAASVPGARGTRGSGGSGGRPPFPHA